MDYEQTARAAVDYARGGERGDMPAELAALADSAREQVLTGARRYAAQDGSRVVEAMVDQLADEYRAGLR